MTPEAFRAWRRALGLSQIEAATRLGLKRRQIQYWESGAREGRPVSVPLTVRLACFALAQGVADYDGRVPTLVKPPEAG
jgi:transcriptional regulator with XRE-family HTH domain